MDGKSNSTKGVFMFTPSHHYLPIIFGFVVIFIVLLVGIARAVRGMFDRALVEEISQKIKSKVPVPVEWISKSRNFEILFKKDGNVLTIIRLSREDNLRIKGTLDVLVPERMYQIMTVGLTYRIGFNPSEHEIEFTESGGVLKTAASNLSTDYEPIQQAKRCMSELGW